MSRCFPFPPPGYEHKATTENLELQPKENHKAKKDKKEKRDKENKEGKERRQKDKRGEKHGDKKDRKEKHKDKDRKKKGKDKDKKKDKDKSKVESRISNEKSINGQIQYQHEEKFEENIQREEPIKDFKSKEELNRGATAESAGAGNKVVDNVVDDLHVSGVGTSEMVGIGRITDIAVDRNLIGNERRGDLGNALLEGAIGNNMTKNLTFAELRNNNRNIHENGGFLGKYENEKIGGIEKTKDSQADMWKRERHKDRSKKVKGGDMEKLKDKMREKGENKAKERRNLAENGQNAPSMKPVLLSKDVGKIAGFDGNLKRKQINGFSHEYDFKPNKLAPLTRQLVDNGICQVTTSDWHGTEVETIVDDKAHKTNGMVHSQPSEGMRIKNALGVNGVTMRPPHPDAKYLSQVLSVPTMEEVPETDDQNWLFGGDLQRRPKRIKADEMADVWVKAQRIEEADIVAMPYVIPY